MEAAQSERNTLARNLAGNLLKLAHKFKVNLDRAVETGDVEAVHDLRVASRRMTEPLLMMEENLPAGDIRSIRKALRRYRRTFRNLRDMDVLIEVLNEASAAESCDCECLIEDLSSKRDRELSRVVRQCSRLPLNRLMRGIRRISREIQTDHLGYRASCALEDLFDQRAEEIRNLDVSEKTPDLHPARIAVKKMKYCTELVDKLHIRDEKSLIEDLSGLQTVLGHWNDRITGARQLSRFAGRRKNLVSKKETCAVALKMAGSILRASATDRKIVEQRWPSLIERLDHISTPGNGFRRSVDHASLTLENA